jgi:hypothetical protein
MPIEIDGVTYFSAADITEKIGVTRQTLWRWRQAGKIPAGRRYRDRQIVFTTAEFQAIREYANRLEPLDPGEVDQLKLFRGQR